MADSDDKILELRSCISDGWKKNKIPLFLFGAKGTPLMIDQYFHINNAIEEYNNTLKKNSTEFNQYSGDKSPLSNQIYRPMQAKIFSDLKVLNNGEIWEIFCQNFVTDWMIKFFTLNKIFTESLDSIYEKISEYFSADTCYPKAIVMTTNFDGVIPYYLTKKTNKLKNDTNENKCLILNSSRQIDMIPSVYNIRCEKKMNPWVIALRGDIYHTICHNPFCSIYNKEISMYEAIYDTNNDFELHKNEIQYGTICNDIVMKNNSINFYNKGDIVQQYELNNKLSCLLEKKKTLIFQCPECGEKRKISISFPGFSKKELEIHEILNSLWCIFGSNISCIVTVGFSGNSDIEIVKQFTKYCETNSCRWFDWTIKNDTNHKTSVQIYGDQFISNRFIQIETETGSRSLSSYLPEYVSPKKIAGLKSKERSNELTADMLWICDSNGDKTLTCYDSVENHPKKITLTKDFNDTISTIFAYITKPNKSSIDMQNTSQLALKNYWWDPGLNSQKTYDPKLHTRLHHSIGVMRISNSWIEYLKNNEPNSAQMLSEGSDLKDIATKINIASLLHDLGHVPFSHLIEEVFNELNWFIDGFTPYSHEQLTKARVLSLLEEIPCTTSELNINGLKSCIVDLIEGKFGIPFIDAITNSPIDSDKIDYIFRDQEWLGIQGRQGKHYQWLSDFFSDMKISKTGQIFLNGKSALAANKLLSERSYLYDNFYNNPKIRVMERMVRYVLTNFFVLEISNKTMDSFTINSSGKNKSNSTIEIDLTDSENHAIETKRAKMIHNDFYKAFVNVLSKDNKIHQDFGIFKVSNSIAKLYEMIDNDFPKLRKLCDYFKNGEGKSFKINGKDRDLIIISHFYDFLKRCGKKLPTSELKIIAEIGLWAIDKIANQEKERKLSRYSSYFKRYFSIISVCSLLLNPAHPLGSTYEDKEVDMGKWADKIFQKHCLGGPFLLYVPKHISSLKDSEAWLKEKKKLIIEIGRQLTQEYPHRVLIDVSGPNKVLSGAKKRTIQSKNNSYYCEQYWVPPGDPQSWSVISEASAPLSSISFRDSIPTAYRLRVLLIDLYETKKGRETILERFFKACNDRNISLERE